MIATYVQPSTKLLQPLPPHFARNFITGGWRKIERMYGARTDQLVKWHEMAGGRDLDAARKAFMATGVVSMPDGGREAV